MISENGIETCIISYMKRVASPGSMHNTGCLGLVCWDDPEGWYREAGIGHKWCVGRMASVTREYNLQGRDVARGQWKTVNAQRKLIYSTKRSE